MANELGRIASRVSPHHNQVRTAHCTPTCSVGGRPILDGAMSAQAVRHESQTQYHRQFEAAAADLMR